MTLDKLTAGQSGTITAVGGEVLTLRKEDASGIEVEVDA